MPVWLVAAGYGALVFLLVWRGLVISLYNGLTGRAGPFLTATIGTFVIQFMLVPWLLLRHWHELTPYNTSFNWPPLVWVIAGVWWIKLLAAWWTWNECRRARLVPFPTIALYVTGWLLTVMALSAFALTALPLDNWTRQVAAFAIGLVVPLARIGLAPVTFAGNRHRRISSSPPATETANAPARGRLLPPWRASPAGSVLVLALGLTVLLAARQVDRAVPQLIEVNAQTYRVLVAGRGSPAVVLEGDMQATLRTWSPIQQALANNTTVVAYERAGYGASSAATRPPTLAQGATALGTLLRQLRIEGPVILVGAHIGAAYAKSFAGMFPDRVDGVVLLEPSEGATSAEILEALHREHPELSERMTAFIGEINALYRPYAIRQLLAVEQELTTIGPPSVESTRAERWQALKAERVYMKSYQFTRADPGAQAEFRQLDALLTEERATDWPAVPLVVLTGAKLGRPSLLERESQQAGPLAARLARRKEWLDAQPMAEHVILPDAGEDLISDAPEAVVREIRKLQQKLRAGDRGR
jgi:pimeloyl-ACP methyl ester carboxylesterase